MCIGPMDVRVALRVLVAEDNPINAEIMGAYLAAGGYACDIVPDGEAAVEAVISADYDIILMDIQMPVVDGLMATKRIRALGGWAQSTPIVAVTAIHTEADAAFLCLVGLDAWVTKPVAREELYAVIEGLVTSRAVAALGPDRPSPTEPPGPRRRISPGPCGGRRTASGRRCRENPC